MWRLWTRGWGVRDWWFWFRTQGFPMWVAWRLPHRLAYWTFIRVYANALESPGPEFDRVCQGWDARRVARITQGAQDRRSTFF